MKTLRKACIITLGGGLTPLSHLIVLFSDLAERVSLITPGVNTSSLLLPQNVSIIDISYTGDMNPMKRVLSNIVMQIRVLFSIARSLRSTDLFIFSIGGEILTIPLLFLKLMGKITILMPGGLAGRVSSLNLDPFKAFIQISMRINLKLATCVVFYSQNMTEEGGLTNYRRKVVIGHEHYVDFDIFKPLQDFKLKQPVVGFIGRFSQEKGILNFLQSIPIVHSFRNDVEFRIFGEGRLEDEVNEIVADSNLGSFVQVSGWIPHEQIPIQMSHLQLLVIPSYTEGLPNVLLEAMACGTPTLATPVGAIPDVINNDITGFLLGSVEPNKIAQRIISLLENPKSLESVSKNAMLFAHTHYSYQTTLSMWKQIINTLHCAP
jgi:glycosyltransferase involved in cell wall biosynthesis